MQMDAGLDTGAMLRTATVPLTAATTATTLHDTLAALGAAMIVPLLADLAAGNIVPQPQPEHGVTYAHKLQKGEGALQWAEPAEVLERQVRGLSPWPGCTMRYQGETIKILGAILADGLADRHSTPGTLLDSHGTIACGQGALRLLRVQRAGKAAIDATALLNGLRLTPGALFANG
jgi:methionyl-tRNA formyltransferase